MASTEGEKQVEVEGFCLFVCLLFWRGRRGGSWSELFRGSRRSGGMEEEEDFGGQVVVECAALHLEAALKAPCGDCGHAKLP